MKLLIVEDEEFTRQGQIFLLRAMYSGIEIVEAFSIAHASGVPDKNSFDYIFLDYGLPDSKGIDSLLTIQEQFVASKVIVVSSDESPSMIRIAIDNDAHGYLPKSFQGDELTNTLRVLLNGTSFFPTKGLKVEPKREKVDAAEQEILNKLTSRQKQALLRLYDAKVDKVIAKELKIQVGTVRRHNYDVYRAFHVGGRNELLAYLKDSPFWINEMEKIRREME